MLKALEQGFVDATRASLLVASVFLLLGLIGAARLRAAARESNDEDAPSPKTKAGPSRATWV